MNPLKKITLTAGVLAVAFIGTGCDDYDTSDRDIVPIEVNHALSEIGSCADYEVYAKEAAIQRMTAMVEKNCQYMLDDVSHWNDDMFGGGWGNDVAEDGATGGDGDVDMDSGGGYSTTNNQEDGVDEADILKTDGEFIYVLSGRDMVIVSIDDEGVLTEHGRITLKGIPEELFLYGDLAVVFGGLEIYEVPESIELPDAPSWGGGWDEPDWDPEWGDSQYTEVQIVDISDKTDPAVIKSTSFAGSYVSSRRVANALRGVLSSPMPVFDVRTYPDVNYWDMGPGQAKHEINKACDALLLENTATIMTATLDDILPRRMASTDGAEAEPIAECEDILGPVTPAGIGLLTILSIDLDDPLADKTDVGVVGQEGLVYASQSSLYLTTARDYAFDAWASGMWMDETSGIHKFDIENSAGEATYTATGTVSGRMLDQFCLGEHRDYLRVATTTGSAWWEENTLDNHITIFEEVGSELRIAGQLDGIGTEEEIYASRFLGTRGFLVTYLQMDPLFTFDLSDPYNPKVVGEWEGPGYSTYLHPYGDDLLIAMGVDGDWRTVISLYDLKQFDNPELVERQPLPGAYYQSAALHEHKAFTFNSETGELLLPFHDNGENMRTGVLLYDITDEGIGLAGTMEMGGEPDIEGPARRSMWNGNNLIGVGACRITTAPLANPTQVISSIPIWEDSCEFPGWWGYYW